ncbi:GNAT family N-acetyltransferase [Chitinophaga sp. 22321]|nr:GNAT family N-acetyltransferase [Chitinophaga hostae]
METTDVMEGEYLVTADKSRLDLHAIHDYLARESYWAQNIPLSIVEKSIAGSLCFGVFHNKQQIGFARLITDSATFAYLADVYILESHRGKGLSKLLMRTVLAHPGVQGLRRMLLVTADAHGLYRQFGFTDVPNPEKFMQLHNPDPYTKKEQ